MIKWEFLSVKDLYEYLSKLMKENKGNCPVGLNLYTGNSSCEGDLLFPKLEIDSLVFDEDTLWFDVCSRNGLPVIK